MQGALMKQDAQMFVPENTYLLLKFHIVFNLWVS